MRAQPPETVRAPRSSVTRVRTLTQAQLTLGIRLARSSTDSVEAKRPRPASAALLDEEPVSRGRRSAASTDRQLCLPALHQSTPSSIRRSASRLPASCLPARFARRASGRGSTTTVAFCSRSGTESLHLRTPTVSSERSPTGHPGARHVVVCGEVETLAVTDR